MRGTGGGSCFELMIGFMLPDSTDWSMDANEEAGRLNKRNSAAIAHFIQKGRAPS
jgi:hypothetical protein